MKSRILMLILLLAACNKKNQVHDPEVFYLDTGGDYYFLEEGTGPEIEEGLLFEVDFDAMNEMEGENSNNLVHKDFKGVMRLENVQNREYRELYSNLQVGDKVIATFSKGSSVEITILGIKELTANIQDSLALIDLYKSTNGHNWIESWDLNAPIKTWKGVTLSDQGNVIQLDLSRNNLQGKLPMSLSFLEFLEYANLEDNVITGRILVQKRSGSLQTFGMEKSAHNESQLQDFVYYFLQDSFLVVNGRDSLIFKQNDMFDHVSIGDAVEGAADTIAGYGVYLRPYSTQKYDGEHVALPDRFLSTVPVIPVVSSLEEYKSKLHLIGSYTNKSGFKIQGKHIVKDDDSEVTHTEQYGSYEKYQFERGIEVSFSEAYESGGVTVLYATGGTFDMYDVYQRTIPFFPENIRNMFYSEGIYKMPQVQMDTVLEYNRLQIEFDEEGELNRFALEALECGDWYTITKENGYIRVEFGGGC